MNRKETGFAALLVGLVAAGCGGGGQQGADAADVAGAADGAADGGAPAKSDGASDLALDGPPKPPPVTSDGGRLVVPGAASLIGSGPDSCTNQVPPAGDRWCGFARATSTPGVQELWVIDATQAAKGVAIACDGSDTSCVRLSTSVFRDPTKGFANSRFTGDTLTYEEATATSVFTSPFLGPIYAWRPGWSGPRALTTVSGVYCAGHARSDSAFCFENPLGDGVTTPLTIELHAGHLSDAAGSTLPTIDTIILSVGTDPVGATPKFQFGLSPDGSYVVWSTRPTPTGVETLEALKVGADESLKLMVAADVSQWAIAPDGSQWYWLAGYNYDVTGAPAGTLQAASFPDGAGVTTVAPNVGEFSLVGGAGLWFRANVTAQVGSLDWMADRGAPAAVTTVDTNVLVVFDETQDGAGFVYAKNFTTLSPVTDSAGGASQPFNLVDLYLGSGTGATPCTLADAPTAFQGALLPSGSGVVWERFNQGTGDTEGLETMAKSCTSTQFAARLRKVSPVMDQGLVYLDDSDPAADESTLRYAPIGEGTPGMGTQLQTRAASVFAVLLPALPAVVYTVGAHTPSDGLYINAALPFTAASAPPAPSP
jgi:hypothetical protein